MWRKAVQRRGLNAKRNGSKRRYQRFTRKKRVTRRYTGKRRTIKRNYKQAARVQSDLQIKLVSSFHHRWEAQASNNMWYTEEICPFKRDNPFWERNGGLQSTHDCLAKHLYVRGGCWNVSITNIDNSDAVVTAYLGFCLDGTDYRTMAGDVRVPWSPYLGFEDVGRRYKISNWKKHFLLKCSDVHESHGATKLFQFKIGSFPVDVNKFIADKKGWPFLWLTWRGIKEWHVKMQIELECQIMFTDNQPHQMSTRELTDLAADIAELKKAMYATGDAEMQTERH